MSRPRSWEEFVARFGVGDVLEGQVFRVVPFGTFVEVADGVHGLLAEQAPNAPGSSITVRIVEIDAERHRVRLENP
jgi:ribosomal protein S1